MTPCDAKLDCLNTDLDERFCVGNLESCNLLCNTDKCLDESFCGGHYYGVQCKYREYATANQICDGKNDCIDGADEVNCSTENVTTCYNLESNTTVPLFNFTRCSARLGRDTIHVKLVQFCEDFADQTNCSDPERVGVVCQVHGYNTTIAKQIICLNSDLFSSPASPVPQLCDDGLDKACVQISLSCFVHKHFMCDGHADCQDLSDETNDQCHVMAFKRCSRRYVETEVKGNISFPLQWIGDGVYDCMDGEDEAADWPTCGYGVTARYASYGSLCMEVYLCDNTNHKFIEFSSLCDKKESCQNENEICYLSREAIKPIAKAVRDQAKRVRILHCLDGLKDVEFLKNSTCSLTVFRNWKGTFGQNKTQEVIVPSTMNDCRHVYGEYYVFLSCLGRCSDSSCPLTREILWNSCSRQFENKKIYTKASDGRLTFLVRDQRTGELGIDVFLCKNNKCVTYDKVCNLVNDCGDSSDELLCTNHFQCETSKEYLAVTQKCDDVIHCTDMSDECNDACGQSIINGYVLKIVAWLTGISSIILNCMSLFKNIVTISKCTSEAALLNNGLIACVCLGDLLMGLYLSVIAAFDSYHGASYCRKHLDWISSDTCAALGVISTTASQLSLFSMAVLALLRISGIRNDFVVPKSVSRRSVMKLASMVLLIVVVSLGISLVPLMRWLEDTFVNGIRFDASNTLFHGCPNKEVLRAILDEYYGRIMAVYLKWTKIMDLIRSMFSNDYNGILYKQQSFYGNDAVCLFKYFVTNDDPQGIFVFILLCFNFSCFVIIGLSYGAMVAKTRKSADIVQATKNADNAAKKPKKVAKLERITIWIIFTDFVCWVPFIVVCCFHYLDIVNATALYSFFSILVLPINSVINPLIYDTSLRTKILSPFGKIKEGVMKLWLLLKHWRNRGTNSSEAVAREGIELQEIKPTSKQVTPGTVDTPKENEEVREKDEEGIAIDRL